MRYAVKLVTAKAAAGPKYVINSTIDIIVLLPLTPPAVGAPNKSHVAISHRYPETNGVLKSLNTGSI